VLKNNAIVVFNHKEEDENRVRYKKKNGERKETALRKRKEKSSLCIAHGVMSQKHANRYSFIYYMILYIYIYIYIYIKDVP